MSKCRDCGRTFLHGDVIIYSALGCYCQNRRNCFNKRKTMPNIKITAEVDGKIIPLNTISTESFEAIKALEKPKEIPVARIGNYRGCSSDKRLFLKISPQLREAITRQQNVKMVAIELIRGHVNNTWSGTNADINLNKLYENVQPL